MEEEEKLQFPAEGATMSFTPKPIGGNSFDIEYSTDDGKTYSKTAPDWIKIDSSEQIVNRVLPHISITVQPQKATITKTATGAGWAYEKGTKEKPYNLSNSKGADEIENTANCYIVNGPGWYRLPLVYGNAIKDGKANTAAYTSESGTFVDHRGKIITQPYIANAYPKEIKAFQKDPDTHYVHSIKDVVWQDVKDLVTGLSVSGSGEEAFLNFRIAPESFDHGNAVIGLENVHGGCLWSWHIWATDYKLGEGDIPYTSSSSTVNITPGNGKTHQFMPINLGWTAEKKGTVTTTENYTARKCKVKFTIINSKEIAAQIVKEIVQQSDESSSTKEVSYGVGQGNNVYYQWGRKDPFPGYKGSHKSPDKVNAPREDKDIYGGFRCFYGSSDGKWRTNGYIPKLCWGISSGIVNYATAINNPGIFFTGAFNIRTKTETMVAQRLNWLASDVNHYDSWCSGLCELYEDKDKETIKTVYDPCPVGYCVPNSYAFCGLENGEGDCGLSRGELFFPASGLRCGDPLDINDGSARSVGVEGYYWSAASYKNDEGCIFHFRKDRATTKFFALTRFLVSCALGLSIRAVREV